MVYLAPMQGLTEIYFRKAYYDTFGTKGIDCAISPFISLTHGTLRNASSKIKDVLPENNIGSLPLIPQILGNEVNEFIELCNRLSDIGYTEVNWNLGCPVKNVTRKKRGSGLLPYPQMIDSILYQVVPKIPCQLSIKMRLGYESAEEMSHIVPILNAYPLKTVIVHPRVGLQMYDGKVDIEAFITCLETLKHRVMYNGDIFSAADFLHIKSLLGERVCDFMIGRGVLINPLLPFELKAMPLDDPKKCYIDFVKNLFERINSRDTVEVSKLRKTKEYWTYMVKSLNISDDERCEPLLIPTLHDVQAAILKILDDNLFRP
jgi:tRNA-dihydrouridine synthase